MTGDEQLWEALTAKCQKIYMKWGNDIKIPDEMAPDPAEVFDQTEVDRNYFALSSMYVSYRNNQAHFRST